MVVGFVVVVVVIIHWYQHCCVRITTIYKMTISFSFEGNFYIFKRTMPMSTVTVFFIFSSHISFGFPYTVRNVVYIALEFFNLIKLWITNNKNGIVLSSRCSIHCMKIKHFRQNFTLLVSSFSWQTQSKTINKVNKKKFWRSALSFHAFVWYFIKRPFILSAILPSFWYPTCSFKFNWYTFPCCLIPCMCMVQ